MSLARLGWVQGSERGCHWVFGRVGNSWTLGSLLGECAGALGPHKELGRKTLARMGSGVSMSGAFRAGVMAQETLALQHLGSLLCASGPWRRGRGKGVVRVISPGRGQPWGRATQKRSGCSGWKSELGPAGLRTIPSQSQSPPSDPWAMDAAEPGRRSGIRDPRGAPPAIPRFLK